MSGILFFSASPEIILFLRPWSNLIDVADLPTIALDLLTIVYTCDLSKTLLNLTT